MNEYKARYLSPMIPSFNVKETGIFFKGILGFLPVMDSETYAIYQKDNLTIHILRAGDDIGQMEFYLEVDNIDDFWASVQNKVSELNVRGPFNREYGMREVHIEIPNSRTLLFVGQQIAQ